jgi:hypothetical protein
MFQRMVSALGLTLALVSVASSALAQGATKAPAAKKGSVYDVEFVFDNTSYIGTMTLAIAKGVVSGSMAIEAPVKVTADVAGTLKGGKLALDYPFQMSGDKPCTGQVVVDAAMDAKANAAQGTAHASGCGNPVDGTFSIKRAPVK